jgi:hypothetical protein
MGLNRLGSRGNVQIKKESSYGVVITPDVKLRVKSSSLDSKPTLTKDDALIGQNMDEFDLVTGYVVGGALEFEAFHPNELFLMQGVFSDEAAVSDPTKSYVIITYNGVSPYARLTLTTTDLLAELSANGSSWSADTNFGTAGTLDLSGATADTITEMVALIAGYTGWDAVYMGVGTEASSNIAAFAATVVKNPTSNCIPLILQSAITVSTTAKTHNLSRPTTSNLPSFSILENRDLGTNKSISFLGNKVSNFTLNAEPQNPIKCSFTFVGRQMVVDQNDVSLTTPTISAFKGKCKLVIVDTSGVIWAVTEVKKLSLQVNPNLHDSKTIEDVYISEPDYQNYVASFSFDLGNNAINYPLKPNYDAGTELKAYMFIGCESYADTTNTIPYSMFFAMPKLYLDNFSSVLSTRDKLMITGNALLRHDITMKTVDNVTAVY